MVGYPYLYMPDCQQCRKSFKPNQTTAKPYGNEAWRALAAPSEMSPQKYCSVRCRTIANSEASFYLRFERYGISVSDYYEILKVQDGRCAICLMVPKTQLSLDIDHDHATGKVRGLLCSVCNTGLGSMRDSIQALQRAIEYLRDPPYLAVVDKSKRTV